MCHGVPHFENCDRAFRNEKLTCTTKQTFIQNQLNELFLAVLLVFSIVFVELF